MPDALSTFAGWTGACTGTGTCQVTLSQARFVAAVFTKVPSSIDTRYYHTDVIGSVRAITDAAGAVVARNDYRPFGEDVAPLTGDPNRFAGKQLDPETALHYFDARYYRNTWGRFTSVDPLQVGAAMTDPQQWNRYAYARNNPLRFTDPTGLYSETITVPGDLTYVQTYDITLTWAVSGSYGMGCFDPPDTSGGWSPTYNNGSCYGWAWVGVPFVDQGAVQTVPSSGTSDGGDTGKGNGGNGNGGNGGNGNNGGNGGGSENGDDGDPPLWACGLDGLVDGLVGWTPVGMLLEFNLFSQGSVAVAGVLDVSSGAIDLERDAAKAAYNAVGGDERLGALQRDAGKSSGRKLARSISKIEVLLTARAASKVGVLVPLAIAVNALDVALDFRSCSGW